MMVRFGDDETWGDPRFGALLVHLRLPMAPQCSLEPTLLHVEPKLLPGKIVSLVGIPTALVGKLTAFEIFVAEFLEHYPEQPNF